MEDKLESLKTFGTEYFKDSFFNKPKKIEPIKYGKYSLQIGRKLDGNIYCLDIKESFRGILLGATRSGKTWLIRALGDRFIKIGNDVVYLSDIKNEFWSSNKELQPKFHELLFEGEKPEATKVIALRPTFFRQIDTTLAKKNYWYSIDGRELTRADFMTLMCAHELTSNQRTGMELIFQEIQKRLKDDPTLQFSTDLINQIIDEDQDIESRQKTALKFKFKPLENSQFIVKKEEKNIVALIKNGFVPAINLENFDSFGKGSFQFPEVTLNIVLREVIKARRAKKINRVLIFIDEATRFIGKQKQTSIKDSVIECLDENTEIVTKDGIKKIKDLDEKRDKIISLKNNKQVFSKFHRFNKGKKEVYEVELENGKKIICTENHRLFKMGFQNKLLEKKLNELKIGDKISFSTFSYCKICNSFIKNTNPNTCSKKCLRKYYSIIRIGEGNPMYGKKRPHSDKAKENISIGFNKMLKTKKGIEYKKNISKRMSISYEERLGKKESDRLKKLRSEDWKWRRKNDPKYDANIVKANKDKKLTKEWKDNIGKGGRKYWTTLSYKEKGDMIKRTIGLNKGKKTNLEREAEKILLKYNFEFYGDGKKKQINGVFPDFVHKTKKIIIEVFVNYWKEITYGSINNYIKIRKKQLKEYKILFFNDYQVRQGIMEDKVNEFFKNQVN